MQNSNMASPVSLAGTAPPIRSSALVVPPAGRAWRCGWRSSHAHDREACSATIAS